MLTTVQIVGYAISAICAVAGLVFGIVYKVKGGNWKKAAAAVTAIGSEFSKLSSLVKKAEQFTNYSGAEKLNYVLTNYKLDCLNNGVKYNEDAAVAQIEEIIDLTKSVNVKTVNVISSEENAK